MKNIITLAALFISLTIFAQVGINNISPKATLDITAKTSDGSKPEGLIAPRLTGNQIQSGTYGPDQVGAIIYATTAATSPNGVTVNITASGYYYFDGSIWQKLSNSSVPTVVVSSSGINGIYKAGTAMTASNTFTVTLTNNSFSTATITFGTSDLALSGVTGLSVASVSTASSTLIAGASVTVTYTLSGTAAACGTLNATWSKLTLNSIKSATVIPNFNCSGGSWVSVTQEYRLNGLINGTAYSGTYTLPYTLGGCNYTGETITQSGLTLTLTAGSYSASGNLTYTLSGTYTGTTNGAVTFTTAGGCTIYLGPCASCKEIKDKGLTTADDVYYVDIDQAGTAYTPMKAQCDMTTDGGGWTLVKNYVHGAGTSTALNDNRTTLPIITSTVATAAGEASNTTSWGGMPQAFIANLLTNGYLVEGWNTTAKQIAYKFNTAGAFSSALTNIPGYGTSGITVFNANNTGANHWFWYDVGNCGDPRFLVGYSWCSDSNLWSIRQAPMVSCGCSASPQNNSVAARLWVR